VLDEVWVMTGVVVLRRLDSGLVRRVAQGEDIDLSVSSSPMVATSVRLRVPFMAVDVAQRNKGENNNSVCSKNGRCASPEPLNNLVLDIASFCLFVCGSNLMLDRQSLIACCEDDCPVCTARRSILYNDLSWAVYLSE
jgi:hypothetical protein